MRNAWAIILLSIAAGGVLLLDGHAELRRIQVSVSTPIQTISVTPGAHGAAVSARASDGSSLPALNDLGRPALPMRIVNVLLPYGARVASVRATSSRSETVAHAVTVATAAAPTPPPDAPAPPRLPVSSAATAPVAAGSVFPSELARYLGTGTWNGYSIASIAVFPVRMENGDLVAYPDIELSVETEAAAPDPGVERAVRMTRQTHARVDAELASLVVNEGEASSYPSIKSGGSGGAFAPSAVPSLEGSPVDYVIVTTAAMSSSFQAFADWKTAKGVPTVVRTVDWILANYRRGTDDAETIRFFLRDAYEKWGVHYVLIAGDTQDVPARYLYSAYYYGGTSIPSDLYYAALDGNFNADGDARFGEQPADAPDLFPELAVGRLPVSNVQDANSVIDKIMTYEAAPDSAYTNKVIFLAEVLFPTPWSPGDPITSNGADIAEFVSVAYVQHPSRTITRLYETPSSYAGALQETSAASLDSLEAGYDICFHVGHGYRFNMHCADGNIAIPEADAMTNATRPCNLFMLNCTAAAFDYDCFAEHMLRNPNGGAVSVVGASNSTFADVSTYYMANYANAVFKQGYTHIGDAFNVSRAGRTLYAVLGDNVDLWTHYVYCALADPEMPLYTGPAETPVVSAPDSVIAGTNAIPIHVDVGGVPMDSATVCLSKDGEDYAVTTTDASGDAVVPFTTETAGTIRLVVSGKNLIRHETSITVHPATDALLALDDMTVDDDSVGGTVGNGDGVIDAGETVDLLPTIRNTGATGALPSTVTLSTTSPYVTLEDSVVTAAPIGAGMSAAASSAWRIHVDAATPDQATARFSVDLTDAGHAWVDGFAKILHAPALEITGLRKSDEIPVGNGDGIITAGEPFLLFCTIKNYGTGRPDGVTTVLRSLGPGATVIDSIAAYPALAPLSEAENLTGFQLTEANVTIENPLEIVVTDSFGRSFTHVFELREPVAPVIQNFDASLGIDKMLVDWDPSPSPDVAGYRVYRATSQAGPFVRATPDIISHIVFTDGGLTPSTLYYYGVTAVDASGNESPMSATAAASTNPPQLVGWPNLLPDPSANSPAVGDIDGDGRDEIIVGNDVMYAWNDDGSELVDGDDQPLTWGVLSPQGVDFIGPAALARLDGSPGLEIVAAAYTSKQVYCFTSTGTVLPGWPRPTIDLVRASVVVGDIDGDGSPEILAVDQAAYLYAWHANGTEVMDGDSNPATDGVFKRLPPTNQWQYQCPAVADLDGNGSDEIIIPTQDNKLYVFEGNGSDYPGWPRTLPNYAGGGVAVGDIDGDGTLEIVVTVRNSGETYAIHRDNTLMWTRWLPQNLFFNPSPALADLTGDGKLEVVIPSSNGKLYAIQYNGSDAPGWPVTYSTKTYTESSPVVADVNGDGVVDVLLGDEGKYIHAWSATGTPLDGFPLVTKDAVRGTPVVADIDKDGDVEIIAAGYDRTVYVWNLNAHYDKTKAPWPMFHANVNRNAVYGFEVATGVTNPAPRAVSFGLEQNYPNPFNPTTTIAFDLAAGPSRAVSLVIYDVTGARVRTLATGSLAGGHHSVAWDGRNDAGSAVGSGVYFYRLATAGHVMTRKMVLLK